MGIISTIQEEWCNGVCGFRPANKEDQDICDKCHDSLYREYTKRLNVEHIIPTIEKEFRWEKNKL